MPRRMEVGEGIIINIPLLIKEIITSPGLQPPPSRKSPRTQQSISGLTQPYGLATSPSPTSHGQTAMVDGDEDALFKEQFIKTEPIVFQSLIDLSDAIGYYEKQSHNRLRIERSSYNSRLYSCVSHIDCPFRARFGPRLADGGIVLKKHQIFHGGRR